MLAACSVYRAARAGRRYIHVVGRLTEVPAGALPDIGVGAEIHHTFHAHDVEAFATLTGDTNPLHLDPTFCATTPFGKPVVHGILVSSLFPTVFGATMPGSVYVSQSLRFHKPIFVNDPLTIRIEVTQVKARMRLVVCATQCVNKEGEIAISGEAKVLIAKPVDEEAD
ncbi:hypothetical protein SPRG_04462 [Saprolegnia parasitica CBS 223.65]|uniref:MaoC-like domain-containing protein n=1 Tax=Saprolegnia parasitica (strain CBS 223.65) TaxID=695850 RepID=A0A067CVK7_SAPPC|nr:hypothetical protein SPRG_04462 [Saprolegnia parasitica CBS 223.65]KDO30561.1 hypothetical protein SPRG_04462 [Saprolegnia parasitica CBS 223.65]|eukprot:XP_012198776.1 hypothetical protein SPRG_04462 [Saprolegnia parasitica CBS 223.65]